MGYGSNFITGAAAGASAGAGLDGWGALAGGVIGGLAGLFGASEDEKSKKAYNDKLAEVAEQYGVSMDQLQKQVEDYYASKGHLLTDDQKKEYKQALTETDWGELGKVDFNKDDYNVEDYYDENKQQLVNKALNDALGSSNVSGSLLGSGAIGQQIDAAVSTEKDLSDKAYDRMTSERSFDYGLASDEASRKLDAVKTKLQTLGSAYESDENSDLTQLETLLGLKQAKANANLQAFMGQQV